jgi:hypothetical protein
LFSSKKSGIVVDGEAQRGSFPLEQVPKNPRPALELDSCTKTGGCVRTLDKSLKPHFSFEAGRGTPTEPRFSTQHFLGIVNLFLFIDEFSPLRDLFRGIPFNDEIKLPEKINRSHI